MPKAAREELGIGEDGIMSDDQTASEQKKPIGEKDGDEDDEEVDESQR